MNVLVVGNGGREHALLWRLAADSPAADFFITRGTPGTEHLGRSIDVSPTDVNALVTAACDLEIDLTVVGPEAPLAAGLADRLAAKKRAVFGPSAAASRIESSKVFAKQLMRGIGVPTAGFEVFTDRKQALDFIAAGPQECVVKADGLAGGKGAIVCRSRNQAREAVEKIMGRREFGEAGDAVVIEELMTGEELSVLALTDGRNVVPLAPSQDHKAVGEGDTGPNTGGMGAYAPVLIADEKLVRTVVETTMEPVVAELARRGTPYRGCLYAGLMIAGGRPRVVEFNCRFGDPESQAVLPLIEGDLLELMKESAAGSLEGVTVPSKAEAAVCVVLANGGYPGSYEKGKAVHFDPSLESDGNVVVFHAGTAGRPEQVVTSGGRVFGVTGLGRDVLEAAESAYRGVAGVSFEGMYFRRDIAWREIARLRAKG